jgi:hypothetical protein
MGRNLRNPMKKTEQARRMLDRDRLTRRTFIRAGGALTLAAAAGCSTMLSGPGQGADGGHDPGQPPVSADRNRSWNDAASDIPGDAQDSQDDALVDAGFPLADAPPSLVGDVIVPAGTYTKQKHLESDFGKLKSGQIIDCSKAMFVQDSGGTRQYAHNFNPRIDGVDNVTIYRLRARGSMKWTQDRTAAYRKPYGNGTNLMLKNCKNVLVKEAFVGTDDLHCNWDHIKIGEGCANLTVEDSAMLFAFDDVSDNPRVIQVTYRRCWLLAMMGPAIENSANKPQTLQDCTIELHQVKNTNKANGVPIRHGIFFKHQGSAPLILHNVWLISWGCSHRSWTSKTWKNLPVKWSGDCRILDLAHLAKHDGKAFNAETHGMPVYTGAQAVALYKQRKKQFLAQHAYMNSVWPDFFTTMEKATGGHVPVPL